MARKSMPAAPGTTTASSGKTAVRTTLKPAFGRGAKRAGAKRGGRAR